MNSGAKSGLYLLAGSALSPKQIRDLCEWFNSHPASEVIELVVSLRNQDVRGGPGDDGAVEGGTDQVRAGHPSRDNEVKREVVRLLRSEAGLSARLAVTLLNEEVRKELMSRSNLDSAAEVRIPAYRKESFHAFLTKLLRVVPPRLLLHLAHRIRNQVVQEGTSAWPLHR